MPANRVHQFVVTVELPEGVTVAEMTGYIDRAVSCRKGGMDPDSPIYDLDGKTVRVRHVPKKRKARKDRKCDA